ncbi:MAG: hypothetical protein O7E52_12730, partial [Candidatus Poribacteria bacterium]|nr:hypothetical protein [Candidatus Poribacteria bacterium]
MLIIFVVFLRVFTPRALASFSLLILVAGCGSIAKGIAEAVLERSEKEDTRACHIEGPASQGLEALLRDQEASRVDGKTTRTLKVLMVHGIGRHLPGYSGRLTEHLMRELELQVREERDKEITLRDPALGEESLGGLRISRFTNKERSRELLFYELTWSEISELEKKAIEFDDSQEYAFRRTALNNVMKKFVNSHISDPLIYLGKYQIKIHTSVRQAFCWMTLGDWDYYPLSTDKPCDFLADSRSQQMLEDDFV